MGDRGGVEETCVKTVIVVVVDGGFILVSDAGVCFCVPQLSGERRGGDERGRCSSEGQDSATLRSAAGGRRGDGQL